MNNINTTLKILFLTIFWVASFTATADNKNNSTPVQLIIDAKLQGMIKAGNVFSYTHQISKPIDLSSGHITGTNKHTPFKIVKEWDASTPLIASAMVNNEQLNSVTLRSDSGANSHSIILTNAFISSFKVLTDDRGIDRLNKNVSELVEFEVTYQKIEWDAGTASAEDAWSTRQE